MKVDFNIAKAANDEARMKSVALDRRGAWR